MFLFLRLPHQKLGPSLACIPKEPLRFLRPHCVQENLWGRGSGREKGAKLRLRCVCVLVQPSPVGVAGLVTEEEGERGRYFLPVVSLPSLCTKARGTPPPPSHREETGEGGRGRGAFLPPHAGGGGGGDQRLLQQPKEDEGGGAEDEDKSAAVAEEGKEVFAIRTTSSVGVERWRRVEGRRRWWEGRRKPAPQPPFPLLLSAD